MKTYEVTAANRYFWQKLVVAARSLDSAEHKFRVFLASRRSLAHERHEFEEGKRYPGEPNHRDCYRYDFDSEQVKETDKHNGVGIVVDMIDSGGNG